MSTWCSCSSHTPPILSTTCPSPHEYFPVSSSSSSRTNRAAVIPNWNMSLTALLPHGTGWKLTSSSVSTARRMSAFFTASNASRSRCSSGISATLLPITSCILVITENEAATRSSFTTVSALPMLGFCRFVAALISSLSPTGRSSTIAFTASTDSRGTASRRSYVSPSHMPVACLSAHHASSNVSRRPSIAAPARAQSSMAFTIVAIHSSFVLSTASAHLSRPSRSSCRNSIAA
mmetsp:Transcript_62115/g.128722  ORF Transcript_62115/g.128722 Transcript_62115/m.128722 type:complete len:234 (-) Transcript_62115:935-1636(-)